MFNSGKCLKKEKKKEIRMQKSTQADYCWTQLWDLDSIYFSDLIGISKLELFLYYNTSTI